MIVNRVLDSTVFQKAIAAATGLALVGFVIVHMLGNLQLFLGQDAINAYAEKLKSFGALLWIARAGLLALLILHITTTVRMHFRNRAARQGRYAVKKPQQSTPSSRYMIVSGTVILLFVLFHLSHFTFGWVQPELYAVEDSAGRHDVYTMVTEGFENYAITGFYIVAMVFLTSHLSHAMFSLLQTLGANIGGADTIVRPVARILAVAIVLGFVAVPVAVVVGYFTG